MSGFYQMARGWQDNEVFTGAYSERDAWVWMIEAAAWKPTTCRIKGQSVPLGRGDLSFSQRFLADKWGWSKSRVDRFMHRLLTANMIFTRSKIGATAGHAAGQGQSIVTICNYDKYQSPEKQQRGNNKPEIGATAGQQRGKEEEGNKGIRKDTPNGVCASERFVLPDFISPDAWEGFLEMRKRKGASPTERAKHLLIAKLAKLSPDGSDCNAILDQSTEGGWTGVFELKGQSNGRTNRPQRDTSPSNPMVIAFARMAGHIDADGNPTPGANRCDATGSPASAREHPRAALVALPGLKHH